MNKKTMIIGAACAVALATVAFAEDNSADLFADTPTDTAPAAAAASTAAATSDFTLKLSGSHEFDYHVPAYTDDGNGTYSGTIKEPAFRNDLGVEVKDGTVKLVSHWGFDVSPLTASASSPNTSWADSVTIKPYENYISWSPDKFRLSAGYQIFSWGVADRKNPTDNLNPRDYTVGVNADKIPVLAADVMYYPSENVSVEGVFIPSKSDSQYPEDFANIVKTANSTLGGLFTAQNTAIAYSDPSYDPKNFVAGAKVNYNSSGLDLSLDYLYDLDQYYTPTFSGMSTLSGTYYVPTSITLDRKRIHRIGGDAKTTIGKFGLWLEAAYNITENSGSSDYSVRKSKLEYTLGSDVNFGPNDVGYVNLQYIGAWIPNYDKDFNPLATASQAMISTTYGTTSSAYEFYQRTFVESLGLDTEGLMQGVTCNVKYELNDALFTPQVTVVYTMPFDYDDSQYTRYGAMALNPELDFKPVDSFHIKLGADLCYAWHKAVGSDTVTLDTTTNAIGAYTPSNNVYLKVVYKWNDDLKK